MSLPSTGTPTQLRHLRTVAALWLACWLASFTFAQNPGQRPPHIGFAYPAGGRIGTTFTVALGGQNLNGATDIRISSPSVTARIVGYDQPMTQKEFNDLREKIQALVEKRAAALGLPTPDRPGFEAKKAAKSANPAAEKPGSPASVAPDTHGEGAAPAIKPEWTPEDEKTLVELRAQLAKRPNRQGNPAIAETVTAELTIAADAAIGDCELRLMTPLGISNPITLQLGDLPEFTDPVVTATTNPAPRPRRAPNTRPNRPESTDTEITLPVVVNGQIMPGEVDRYRFAAKAGQHLTVAVSARALIPYLADAVPGWFQATVALYDPEGREVAYSDSFRFSPDPVLSYEIRADGTYAIEVKDSIYRGREDFVYRIAIGELPFVTSLFPLGGRYSDPSKFEIAGWNLPGNTLVFDPKDKSPGTFVLSVRNRGQASNAVRFALDDEPATQETEPNDQTRSAQTLSLPVVVDGRIQQVGDEDVFRFDGKRGDPIVAEVFARRLGSPLDSRLKLFDAAGRQIAENDDTEDKGAGLETHHADSRIALILPADGTYYVALSDAQHHGGPEYGYRLRLSPPRPDFELRVTPSGINARPGTHVPLTVYALRRDGFAGDILLSLQDAPFGFGLSGGVIPAGQDKVQLTLAVPPRSGGELHALTLVGVATVNGRTIGHTAVPAEDMMQAFAYHHLVPSRELLVDVAGRPGASCRLLGGVPVRIPAGGVAVVKASTTTARGIQTLSIELTDPPAGVTVKNSTATGDVLEITLACDAKAAPGTKGNMILTAYGERANPNAKKGAQPTRFPLGSMPAIPFEVVAPSTAKSSTSP